MGMENGECGMGNGAPGKISSKITEKLASQVTKVVKKKEIEKEATRVAFSKAISNCNLRILQIEIECEASVKKFLTKKPKWEST